MTWKHTKYPFRPLLFGLFGAAGGEHSLAEWTRRTTNGAIIRVSQEMMDKFFHSPNFWFTP